MLDIQGIVEDEFYPSVRDSDHLRCSEGYAFLQGIQGFFVGSFSLEEGGTADYPSGGVFIPVCVVPVDIDTVFFGGFDDPLIRSSGDWKDHVHPGLDHCVGHFPGSGCIVPVSYDTKIEAHILVYPPGTGEEARAD